VIKRIHQWRGFAAAVLTVAFLFGCEFLITAAIASRMEALDLVFGTADTLICSSGSDRANQPVSKHLLVHKSLCRICAFAAKGGLAPGYEPFHATYFALFQEEPSPQPAHDGILKRHDPRVTRGPPALDV